MIEHLNEIETWENEEIFLRDTLVLSSVKLLLNRHKEVDGSIVIIAPLLRQVQENIVALVGMTDCSYTLKEFVEKKPNPKNIMKSIRIKNQDINENEFNMVNSYLTIVKEMLNKFSHTNFEVVMTLFTERFEVYEYQRLNKVLLLYMINLLEAPIITLSNLIYKLELDFASMTNLKMELKNIKSLKYLLPEGFLTLFDSLLIIRKYLLGTIRMLH